MDQSIITHARHYSIDGDGIMAVFGAPQPSPNPCVAAQLAGHADLVPRRAHPIKGHSAVEIFRYDRIEPTTGS